MRTVALPRSGITTTRLGFGTAGLLREPSKRRRLDILSAALDTGIRHFDTAPIYGFGEAERILGEFLATRREPVTIATKFGLAVSAGVGRLAPIQSVGRAVLGMLPAVRRMVRRRAARLYQPPRFDAESARASFERSRAALRRDGVDMLLLHDCTPQTVQDGSLLDCLEGLRARRRITAFGTATSFDHTLEMLASRTAYCGVLQFESDVLRRNALRVPAAAGAAVVTHSALARSRAALARALELDANLRTRWSAALGADVTDAATLSRLLLQAALLANPDGIVLVHSNSVPHIAANAAAAEATPDPEQIARLEDLVRAHFESGPVAARA
jgi:aryl-alcohol dehydrogenase-like predicted oxidoreductase